MFLPLYGADSHYISSSPPPSHLHEALQRRTHIPLLFCRGSEGLPLCLLDLSPRSWTQRFLHSKCCRCRPAGINCRHVQRINGSTALTGLVKERKAYRSLNKSRNKSTFKKHWKHWVWLLWAKPHERLYNALQAYKVEGLVHPNNKEKKKSQANYCCHPYKWHKQHLVWPWDLREISSESTKFYCQQFPLLAAVISRQISQIRAHRKQKYLEGSTATRLSEKIWLFAISVKCPFNPTLECGLRDKL